MSEVYITCYDLHRKDKWNVRQVRHDRPPLRAIAKIEGKAVAVDVAKALTAEFQGEEYMAPRFSIRSVAIFEDRDRLTAARWNVYIEQLSGKIGRADDADEKSRDAGYHHMAMELEQQFRRLKRMPPVSEPEAGGDTPETLHEAGNGKAVTESDDAGGAADVQDLAEPDGAGAEKKIEGSKDPKTSKRRKRGRPTDTDHAKDKRIYEAWESRRYENRADLARELKITERDVNLAHDRHRKRLNAKRK